MKPRTIQGTCTDCDWTTERIAIESGGARLVEMSCNLHERETRPEPKVRTLVSGLTYFPQAHGHFTSMRIEEPEPDQEPDLLDMDAP